ncbi:hypothetical protein ACHQM5_003147 [Ranunculus cassubicifolius]
MHARREKGLCYNCEEIYSFGHKCKNKQLFMLAGEWDEDCTPPESPSSSNLGEISGDGQAVSEIAISLSALAGNSSFQTLQLKGTVQNRSITMLVDSGSTHNFLDLDTAEQLGFPLIVTPTHSITVVGGGKLQCDTLCEGFTWEIQGIPFSSDVRVLPLGGCGLVLGVQWLKAIGPVLMDFSKLQMEFEHRGRRLTITGDTTPAPIQFMSMRAVQKLAGHNSMSMMGMVVTVADIIFRLYSAHKRSLG